MVKVTFSVGGIATQYAAGYRSIEAGRAATQADALAKSGTFSNLGVVLTLIPGVESYDFNDSGAARGQWHVFRLKKANGDYSAWFAPQQGWAAGYLTVEEFKAYEMGDLNDFEGQPLSDSKLERFIGLASRAADAYCGQHFGLEQVTERHRWRQETRRIYPRQSNAVSVSSLKIYVSSGQLATFNLADLFINSNENWVEITSLASVTYSIFPAIVALGLTTPTAEITYIHGFDPIPQDIQDATAFIAVDLLGRDALAKQGTIGLNRLIVGDTQMFLNVPEKGMPHQHIPQHAAAILDRYVKVNIR
jgi:hypothetical protein